MASSSSSKDQLVAKTKLFATQWNRERGGDTPDEIKRWKARIFTPPQFYDRSQLNETLSLIASMAEVTMGDITMPISVQASLLVREFGRRLLESEQLMLIEQTVGQFDPETGLGLPVTPFFVGIVMTMVYARDNQLPSNDYRVMEAVVNTAVAIAGGDEENVHATLGVCAYLALLAGSTATTEHAPTWTTGPIKAGLMTTTGPETRKVEFIIQPIRDFCAARYVLSGKPSQYGFRLNDEQYLFNHAWTPVYHMIAARDGWHYMRKIAFTQDDSTLDRWLHCKFSRSERKVIEGLIEPCLAESQLLSLDYEWKDVVNEHGRRLLWMKASWLKDEHSVNLWFKGLWTAIGGGGGVPRPPASRLGRYFTWQDLRYFNLRDQRVVVVVAPDLPDMEPTGLSLAERLRTTVVPTMR